MCVIDVKTLQTIKEIPLSGRPNNITVTPDGRKVYVAIRSEPGAIDVIDTRSLEKIKTIPTDGGMHNTYATPDGKYILAAATGGQHMLVLDAATRANRCGGSSIGVCVPSRLKRMPMAPPSGCSSSLPTFMVSQSLISRNGK